MELTCRLLSLAKIPVLASTLVIKLAARGREHGRRRTMPTYSWSETLSNISANPPKGSKLALVILTELSSILYSGTVFGWAPILLVLRDEGLFADVCDEGESNWCDARKEKLVRTILFDVERGHL